MTFPFHQMSQGAIGQRHADLTQLDQEFRLRDKPTQRPPPITPHDTADEVVTYAGLDFGQMTDPCALAMVRTHRYHEGMAGPRWPYLEVCRLHRWQTGPSGAKYRDVIEQVLGLRPDVLCYDYGGVGAGLVDTIRSAAQALDPPSTTRLVPIRTVGASNAIRILASPETRYVTVPKVDLVTGLNVLAEQRVVKHCPHCNAVTAGEEAVVRFGKHANETVQVVSVNAEDDTAVVRLPSGNKGMIELEGLYRKRARSSCPSCSYLRFCVGNERLVTQLLQEMATFRERQMSGGGGQGKTVSQGGKGHHGDMVVALALAVFVLSRTRRQLILH